VIANAAMQAGKHVYVQKPLTYTVHEARALRATAKRTGVVTQMGNQGHSTEGARLINEWIQAGIIGAVTEVHIWTNRPIWPQGIPRPAPDIEPSYGAAPAASWNQRAINQTLARVMGGSHPVPEGLDWDLYCGPIANDVRYHPVYHPFNWRGWVDFGVGALGDMGAHLLDHPYWALGLTYPTSIEATSTPWGGPQDDPVTYPAAMLVHYEFPARGAQPPVKLSWYDGGLMPARPHQLPDDVKLEREGGVIYVGSKGILLHETYASNPRVFPQALMESAASVPRTVARVDVSHEMNWALACKGRGSASCPIDYAAPLTETMLLGIAALRAGQGRKIYYDAERMSFTNAPDADRYLTREYRAGWSL
jgi:predicted dehydrogenase